ncbi:hypothetical protein BV898_14909 [Hypsibius exemplaris]|uniref:Vitellogenin domain-containing protein n=1 Tax=Hypsibius exemplaris TaxID=2072580 RepID=A0A9X6RJZ0_HYPEX|nr:hypothetical protein BV898_14909 [Hypsibius exemplaris]
MDQLVSCFVLKFTYFLFLAGGGHGAPPTVTKSETLGWGAIEVSPNAFISLEYDNFHVSIYKKEGSGDSSSERFYCSPALILQPNSTTTHRNYFTETFETVFEVKMWYPEYWKAIQTAVSSELGRNVSKHSIRMLPIEDIRIESKVRSEKYYIANEWTSYANQPSTFAFRITCSTNETCIEVADNIRHHPKVFTSSLEVFYSLQTHRTEKRSVEIKFQHMQRSELFGKMLRKFPNEEKIYLPVADLKKMELVVSNNVITTEIQNENFFISSDEVVSHLEELMEVEKVGSSDLTHDMWDAVFWTAKNARPDITTKIMNEIYDKNDRHLRDALKRVMISTSSQVADSERSSAIVLTTRVAASSESAILFEDLRTIWSSLKANGNWGIVCPDKNTSQAGLKSVNEEQSRLRSLLMDARQFSMWDGEKFVIKPFQMTKISLAAFRGATTSTTVIANIQMKLARTTSELKTPINVPKTSAYEGEMPGQVQYGKQISLLDAFARSEISRISETLREIKTNLSESEALVLSAASLKIDGQLANFSVTIQGIFALETA